MTTAILGLLLCAIVSIATYMLGLAQGTKYGVRQALTKIHAEHPDLYDTLMKREAHS